MEDIALKKYVFTNKREEIFTKIVAMFCFRSAKPSDRRKNSNNCAGDLIE